MSATGPWDRKALKSAQATLTNNARKRGFRGRVELIFHPEDESSDDEGGLETIGLPSSFKRQVMAQPQQSDAYAQPLTFTITVIVGSKVRKYRNEGEIWQPWIEKLAMQMMDEELLTATKTVRGLVDRTKAILEQQDPIVVPAEVINSLKKDLALRKDVSAEYLKISENAKVGSPLWEGNRSHAHFQKCLEKILTLLLNHINREKGA